MTTRSGMFYARNGGPARPHLFEVPLRVARGDQVEIFIHQVANLVWMVSDQAAPTLPLLPTLLGEVGADARITITISNSANLTLGYPCQLVGPALIGPLVQGPIAPGAHIAISLSNCANVLLATPEASLMLAQGELIASQSGASLHRHQCGQVNHAMPGSGCVSIVNGELVDELIDTHTLIDCTVDIRVERVANVRCQSLSIVEGELMDESLDADCVLRSKVRISLSDSANVEAG
ncbi:hypothetical protein [Pseudomonas sp. KNUC1026]|uniref:hypothetical protein n=1 Tax=Pseudomonas sp. KNUC1026 TaxID=2893890 RepID=UPI001F4316E6|nr:hypothetical protein [Pseudomonas sp. KNUC1026]UFH51430.1 hypothetical protein LN139_10765 [Pseudomonas sp. KNUC1026]